MSDMDEGDRDAKCRKCGCWILEPTPDAKYHLPESWLCAPCKGMPDRDCNTLPNGDCIAPSCMHTPPIGSLRQNGAHTDVYSGPKMGWVSHHMNETLPYKSDWDVPIQKAEQPMSENIALIDMDSTLCDFEGTMRRNLEALASPLEISRADDIYSDNLPHIESRRHLIKQEPGWWLNLPRYEPGFDILAVLEDLGYKVHVLTKGPRRTTAAWTEKVEWCRMHLAHRPVTVTDDKSLMYGKVLVDDWPEYVNGWLKHRPRGLVIMPLHPWNKDCKGENIVHYTGDNMPQVRNALKARLENRWIPDSSM